MKKWILFATTMFFGFTAQASHWGDVDLKDESQMALFKVGCEYQYAMIVDAAKKQGESVHIVSGEYVGGMSPDGGIVTEYTFDLRIQHELATGFKTVQLVLTDKINQDSRTLSCKKK